MMARRAAIGFFAAGISVVLSGCDGLTHERFEPIRYRLTAEVETPEGLRIGSSVIEVTWAMSRTSPPLGGAGYSVKGEAAAVDLPMGDTLFVLLRSADDVDWAAWVIKKIPTAGKAEQPKPNAGDREAQVASTRRELDLIRADRSVYPVWNPKAPHAMPGIDTPTMVRFRDTDDPMSVESVDPVDFAKVLGPGYRLKALTVQITDDPVTLGIEKRLRWLGLHKGMLDNSGDANRLHKEAAKNLTKRDFVRGNLK